VVIALGAVDFRDAQGSSPGCDRSRLTAPGKIGDTCRAMVPETRGNGLARRGDRRLGSPGWRPERRRTVRE